MFPLFKNLVSEFSMYTNFIKYKSPPAMCGRWLLYWTVQVEKKKSAGSYLEPLHSVLFPSSFSAATDQREIPKSSFLKFLVLFQQ